MSYMQRAIQLAYKAAGLVAPRPAVGAVIVKDDTVVGEGYTQPLPGPHAEIVALNQAGEAARGATLYCTLEPCSHTGATPPCTDSVIAAGIARVVCPVVDPHPQVNGRGFARLKDAGIEVVNEVPQEEAQAAERIIEGFRKYALTGRPLVTVKFAMSLDGKIATRTGESQWITGPEARAEAHALRAQADVVLTGIGTVLSDDPRLTARDAEDRYTGRPLLRVIVDTRSGLPRTVRLFEEPGDVLWVRGEGAPPPYKKAGLEAIELPCRGGRVDLDALITELGQRRMTSVLVEAGGRLLGSFFDMRLVDRVAAFIAPVIIGGVDAPGPVGGEGVSRLAEALRLHGVETRRMGDDTLITGYVRQK